ncbi:MAG: hypothetical protein ABIH66_07245 [bacterium]
MKITPRQQGIIEALAKKLQEAEGSLSLLAAKGIIHYAIESACGKWNIELSEAQEFPTEKKITFMGDILANLRERLARFQVPEDRAREIAENLMAEYKNVM